MTFFARDTSRREQPNACVICAQLAPSRHIAMICLKLATRTGSFQVEVDATPADCGVANNNYERKPHAVPGTWNTGTNYADSRYQLPQIDIENRNVIERREEGSGGIPHVITHTTSTNAEVISGTGDIADQPMLVAALDGHAGAS